MIAPWPEPVAVETEGDMAFLQEVIRTVRNLRAEAKAPPGRRGKALIRLTADRRRILEGHLDYVLVLASLGGIEYLEEEAEDPSKAMSGRIPGGQVFLPLEGLVDLAGERARLGKEEVELLAELERVRVKLGNAGFMAKAPAEVVAGVRAKEEDLRGRLMAVRQRTRLWSDRGTP